MYNNLWKVYGLAFMACSPPHNEVVRLVALPFFISFFLHLEYEMYFIIYESAAFQCFLHIFCKFLE